MLRIVRLLAGAILAPWLVVGALTAVVLFGALAAVALAIAGKLLG